MKAKLYSPVFCEMWGYEEYNGGHLTEVGRRSATSYLDKIRNAIFNERRPEAAERGLMEYYGKADSVNEKVQSLFVDADIYDKRLWAAATLELKETLTPDEISVLKDYLTGQYSDGFGEDLEQREIRTDEGELFVHLWKNDGEFFIDTQEQFSRRLGIPLPPDALTSITAADIPPPKAPLPDLEELIERFYNRIDENLNDFFQIIRNDVALESIPADSKKIAAMFDAHWFLKIVDVDDWHTPDLEYLLRFENPLKLFADKLPGSASAQIDMFDIMFSEDGILDRRILKPSGYALTPEANAVYLEEPENRLRDRLAENFGTYERDMLNMDKEKIFYKANQIVTVMQAYEYFSREHSFTKAEVDFLLKFQNPLKMISDRWAGMPEPRNMINAMLRDKERILRQSNYALMPDGADAALIAPKYPSTEQEHPQEAIAADGKPIVKGETKQEEEEAKEQDGGFLSVLKKIQDSKQTPYLLKDESDIKKRKKQETDL